MQLVNTFVTSDTHFGHKNILRYNNRPFESIEQHDEAIIASWNNKIQPNDEVYHLGDFSMSSKTQTINLLRRLHGNIHLILGNHDQVVTKNYNVRSVFQTVQYYKELRIDDYLICLFHYPIHEWNKCNRGSIMLHGHTHGHNTYDPKFRILDVCVDSHNYMPIDIKDAIKLTSKKIDKSHH